MSFVAATPGTLSSASTALGNVGSAITTANALAAPATTTVVAAAGDEVSAAISSLFSSHARQFQSLSAQAAAFHAEFVRALSGAGAGYAAAEAAKPAWGEQPEPEAVLPSPPRPAALRATQAATVAPEAPPAEQAEAAELRPTAVSTAGLSMVIPAPPGKGATPAAMAATAAHTRTQAATAEPLATAAPAVWAQATGLSTTAPTANPPSATSFIATRRPSTRRERLRLHGRGFSSARTAPRSRAGIRPRPARC
jgi:hypothetical protein